MAFSFMHHVIEHVEETISSLRKLLSESGFLIQGKHLEEIVSDYYLTSMDAKAYVDVPTPFSKPDSFPPPTLGHEIPPWEDLPSEALVEDNQIRFNYDLGLASPITDSQVKGFLSIVDWLNDKNTESAFILRGGAGTGKTTLLRLLNLNARLLNVPEIIYSSPSNKAAQIISGMLNVRARTVYSVLGLRMVAEEDEMVLKAGSTEVEFTPGSLLVIDEAGIAPEVLLPHVENIIKHMNVKVLLVGDPFQWTPINEKRSKLWKLCTDIDRFRVSLTEPVRFDSDILDLSLDIRGMIQTRTFTGLTSITKKYKDSKVITHIPHKSMAEHLKSMIKVPTDVRKVRGLAWRNDVCTELNNSVRAAFGFTERWHAGEICCVASPIMVDGKVKHFIDDEGLVRSVIPGTSLLSNGVEIDVLTMSVEFESCVTTLTVVANESSEDALNDLLATLNGKAKAIRDKEKRNMAWRKFWSTKEAYHTVRYPYAQTSHRLQGSTYEAVVIDHRDITSIPDKLSIARALYVGCTRPSQHLYIAR